MLRSTSGNWAILGFLLINAMPAVAEEPDGARLRFLVSALDRKIDEVEKGKFTLPEMLEKLSKLASLPGHEKDPAKRVNIICNFDALKRESMDFDENREEIKIAKKLTSERLDTLLAFTCRQTTVGGVVFVRDDYIEIIPRSKAMKELGLQLADDEPMPVLIHQFFSKVPLEKALKQISERYAQNIVLAPLAESKRATPITARLVNVPIDVAVETLANIAELKVVRKPNILYVTTKEQAATLRAEDAKITKEPKKTPKEPMP